MTEKNRKPSIAALFSTSSRRWTALAAVLVLLGGSVFAAYANVLPQRQQTDIKLVPVAYGDINATVSATGTVQAPAQVKLNFAGGTGRIAAVSVQVGDTVKEGQILAALDDRNAKAQLDNTLANLTAARAKLAQAKQGASDEAIALQQANLEKARIAWEGAKTAYANQQAIFDDRSQAYQQVVSTENQVRQAEIQVNNAAAGLDAAKAKLAAVRQGASAEALNAAQVAVDAAQAAYDNAQAALEAAPPEGVAAAQASYNQAKVSLANARKQLADLEALPDESQVAQAEASVKQAEGALEQARANLDAARQNRDLVQAGYHDRTQAKAQLDQAKNSMDQAEAVYKAAQAQLNQTMAPPDEAAVQAAEAAVRQAEAQVRQQQAALDNLTLKAVMDGVIIQVNGRPGEMAANGAPMVVMNSNEQDLQVMAQVSQADVAKVKGGLAAEFVASSYEDRTFHGKVLMVYPEATTANGVTSYNVLLSVANPDNLLKPGMTVSTTIQAESRQHVLVVPAQALKEQNGQDGVYVAIPGANPPALEFRPVSIGLYGGENVEIVAGLQEGDRVSLQGNRTPEKAAPGGMSLFKGIGKGGK